MMICDVICQKNSGPEMVECGKFKQEKELTGRPERTRTADLYRVKVAL